MIHHNKIVNIYYFDSSKYISWATWLFKIVFNFKIQILHFSFDDLKDDNGTNLIYKIMTKDYKYIWSRLEEIKYSKSDNRKENEEK